MKVLVIAPHPDDETLGCGGTLFRHKEEGDEIYWAIITSISIKDGWPEKIVDARYKEIDEVKKKYAFNDIFNFNLPSTKLETLSHNEILNKILDVYKKIQPEIIYTPYMNDVHTDHQIIAKLMQSTFKWFRHPYIRKVLIYETISETDFNFNSRSFKPNTFIDISGYLNDKIEAMKIYKSELGQFPFPRSEKVIKSLAAIRGSQSGFEAAESFELVYDRK